MYGATLVELTNEAPVMVVPVESEKTVSRGNPFAFGLNEKSMLSG